jgi:hypothetical protein
MFITNVNPLSIVEVVGKYENNTAIMNVITKSAEKKYVYWRHDLYGTIRGGTPALFIKGYYLAFFHTSQHLFHGSSYFMGAITFCPHPPFDIYSTSSHPIIDEDWYEGKWLTNRIDYAVFPIGLMLDPHDNDYIWVSMGVRDKDGLVLHIHIDELYESMTVQDESSCR